MALSKARNTPRREHFSPSRFVPANGAVIHKGGLVALNAAGDLVPGSVSTTLTAVGRAETSTAADPTGVDVLRGTFAWGNSASADAVTKADWGKPVYIVDDETVARTSGTNTRSVAGICRGLDEAGRVWVET